MLQRHMDFIDSYMRRVKRDSVENKSHDFTLMYTSNYEDGPDAKVERRTSYTFNHKFDYSLLLVYPLMVLSINRALDTVISRTPSSVGSLKLINDLSNTYKIGQFKALYAGIVSTVFFKLIFTGTLYKNHTD